MSGPTLAPQYLDHWLCDPLMDVESMATPSGGRPQAVDQEAERAVGVQTTIVLDSYLLCFSLAVPVVLGAGSPPLPVLLPAATGQGLQISGRVERKDGQVVYHVLLENGTSTVLDGFMMQLNKNTFGLAATPGPLPVCRPCPGEAV